MPALRRFALVLPILLVLAACKSGDSNLGEGPVNPAGELALPSQEETRVVPGSACEQSGPTLPYSVGLEARVTRAPASVTLSWPAADGTASYTVLKRSAPGAAWQPLQSGIPAATLSLTDTEVSAGSAYEYRIERIASAGYAIGYGYLAAAIDAPLIEARGKLVLIVDASQSAPLASELARLERDLVGDGWTVLRHDVARDAQPAAVKALIKADYDADPAGTRAVFLFGHVPIVKSGLSSPDGHHSRSWPTDVYYADMDGAWTDTADGWGRVAGDGIFDQGTTYGTNAPELAIGRVDLYDMPAFARSETELLRQYLDKDHRFRHAELAHVARGLVNDNFGAFSGEAFAANGWRNFAPLVGRANSCNQPFMSTLASESYLLAYGTGPGSYEGAGGVGGTGDFAGNDIKAVFTLLFGSYFGEWSTPNNFLRAPLAGATSGLTSAWAGRPNWFVHHLAIGATIGDSTRLAQTNTDYSKGYQPMGAGAGGLHAGLMGDPTLRLHPVAPPRAPAGTLEDGGTALLSWQASPDADVLGYHVYEGASPAGPFRRVSASLFNATAYRLKREVTGKSYQVRAVKLQSSPSGTYFNASQGVTIGF